MAQTAQCDSKKPEPQPVVAAIVTPTPDATTMLVFMAPMIGLYFLGIAVSAVVTRRRARRLAAPAEAG